MDEKWWLPLVSVVVPEVRNVVVISEGLREVGFSLSLKASVGMAGMSLMEVSFFMFRELQYF